MRITKAVKHGLFHAGATIAAVGVALSPAIPIVAKFLPPPWNLIASAGVAGVQGVVAYRSKAVHKSKPIASNSLDK